MIIIGLSGAIASGKNFVAEFFAQKNAAIFDADKETHDLLATNKQAISQISQNFPQAIIDGKISRKILGEIVFFDPAKLQILEQIIHPLIREKYDDFITQEKHKNTRIVVLNIPLLLEKNFYKCDKIIALILPSILQKQRFITRHKNQSWGSPQAGRASLREKDTNWGSPQAESRAHFGEKNYLQKKFAAISALQIDNETRKKKSDFVVDTGLSKANTLEQLEKIWHENFAI